MNEIKKSFAETYARLFSPLTIFVFAACWIMASLAGPFGTYEAMPLNLRAMYWFGIVAAAIVVGFGVFALTSAVMDRTRPLRADFGAAVLMTVVFAPYVIGLRSFFATMSDGLIVTPLTIVINTFLLSLAIFVLRRQLIATEPGRYLVSEAAEVPSGTASLQPRLLRRLDPEVQGAVLRLSASDHHVTVVTEKGSQTLRLRLGDAIDEMEPVEGLCTHRSHWVARDAIRGVERENAHKLFVRLSNGDKVPVSRGYRPRLEEAGVIEANDNTRIRKRVS